MSQSVKYIASDQRRVRDVLNAVYAMVNKAVVRGPVEITLARPKRSLDQNRLLWAILRDFSAQVEHFGNKYGSEDWKAILTAAFENEVRSAPTLDGRGLVFLGGRTSKYTKPRFSAFMEFLFAEGSERNIEWSNQSNDAFEEVRG